MVNLLKKGKGGRWLSEHLESFVKPYLGYIPDTEGSELRKMYLSSVEMTLIKNIWRSLKKRAREEKKIIVLPGRDVFIFEILARREGIPTIFMPECSRQTVQEVKLPINPTKAIILDTGFLGTIPNTLGVKSFGMVSHHDRSASNPNQIFPLLTFSRNLALKIEKTPKYWKSGKIEYKNYVNPTKRVVQVLSDKAEFHKAALLTIEIYKDSSPKFVNQRGALKNDFRNRRDPFQNTYIWT